jgi:VanZ family protein
VETTFHFTPPPKRALKPASGVSNADRLPTKHEGTTIDRVSHAMTSTRIWRLVALGFTLFILLVAIGADTQRLPQALYALYEYPGGDKVGHFWLYGMLGFLGGKAWRRPLCSKLSLPVGVLPAALLAVLEEVSQLFFAGRAADWLDLGAGFAGIGVAVLMVTVGPLRNRTPRVSHARPDV